MRGFERETLFKRFLDLISTPHMILLSFSLQWIELSSLLFIHGRASVVKCENLISLMRGFVWILFSLLVHFSILQKVQYEN